MIIINGKIFTDEAIIDALVKGGADIPSPRSGMHQICIATKGPDGYICAYSSFDEEYHGIAIDVVSPKNLNEGEFAWGTALAVIENPEPCVRENNTASIQGFIYENLNDDEATQRVDFIRK